MSGEAAKSACIYPICSHCFVSIPKALGRKPTLMGSSCTFSKKQNILENVEHCGGEPEQADKEILSLMSDVI